MRLLLFLAALGAAPCAASPELVSVPTRPGVPQPFVILPMDGRAPQAIAVLYIGGGGRINARREDGQVKFGARNGVLPAVMDAPSVHAEPTDGYRVGREQSADARAVVEELKRRFPGLPVYAVGTSRGTISAAFVLRGFDYASIGSRLLFVHHRDDGCEHTPYASTSRLAPPHELITVAGGGPSESAPCDPFSAHGFFGVEAATVDAIAAWMLKRACPKQVP